MEVHLQDEEDGGGTAKRIKLNVDNQSIEGTNLPEQVGPSLLDLSDDVLLIILALLSPTDLINLSQSCSRLWNVTRDRTLWSHVDCRENALDADVFEETYLDYLLPGTRFLAIDFRLKNHRKKGLRPPVSTQGPLTFHLLKQITSVCIKLDTLILQDVCFDALQIPLKQFPATLTHLSLKNSDVQNLPVRVSYFNDIQKIMPNLQVLILSHSLWLESHSLMAISKCPKLKELRLQGCYALGDCIAYFSIATRFGFKDLETLDLRGTQVGDPEVSCLNLVPSLRHLYLESITQYARRRDAEYYMNRMRQYPDITIVPHPDAGPVQNPVILLQRIDGEMVARNVTGEFHGLRPSPPPGNARPYTPHRPAPPPPQEAAHSRCVRALVERWEAQQPGTSRTTSTAFMQRLRERWQISDRRRLGSPSRTHPVVVVPMKRARRAENTSSAGTSNPTERCFDETLVRIIPDMCTTGLSDRPTSIGPANPAETPGPSKPNQMGNGNEVNGESNGNNFTGGGNEECHSGEVQDADGETSCANVQSCGNDMKGKCLLDDKTKSDTDVQNLLREVKVEEGRVLVQINNGQTTTDDNEVDNDTDAKRLLREVKVEEGRVVVLINNNANAQGSLEEGMSNNHCSTEPSSTLTDERSDTNDSDCGRDGGDEADSSNPDLRRFKKPFLRNAASKSGGKTESDEDSDVGSEPNYREYTSTYMTGRPIRHRFPPWPSHSKEETSDKTTSTGDDAVGAFPIDNGPCCSYRDVASATTSGIVGSLPNCSRYDPPGGLLPTDGPSCSYIPTVRDVASTAAPGDSVSLPNCSRYDQQRSIGIPSTDGPSCSKSDYRKRKRRVTNPQSPNSDEGNFSSEGEDSEDSDSGGESEEELRRNAPPALPHSSSSLHFCTIGRTRFHGLTVPFLHRVPQVTDSCVHAVCSGKASHLRPPHCIMTLRLATGPRAAEQPAHECRLETLVLRHFPKVTDHSLYALARLLSLRVLDVTGTSITACGVKNFRLMRPDVKVTSDHDNPAEP